MLGLWAFYKPYCYSVLELSTKENKLQEIILQSHSLFGNGILGLKIMIGTLVWLFTFNKYNMSLSQIRTEYSFGSWTQSENCTSLSPQNLTHA